MAVSAISNLNTWLSQVNGSQSQNLNANASGSATQSSGASQTSSAGQANTGQLVALFENLMQQLAAAGGTSSAAAGAAQTAAQSTTQGVKGHGHHAHAGGQSGSGDLQATLNQLLQELKLGSSSTNTTAGSAVASAQSPSSQQRLMGMLQRLVQGSAASAGSIVSALV